MSKIYTSADQLIGHTPLLELTHIEKEADLAKTIESRFRKKEAKTHLHTALFLKTRCRQFYACTLKFSFLLRISNYLYLRCLKSRFIVAKHQYACNHADKQQRTNFKSRTNGKS